MKYGQWLIAPLCVLALCVQADEYQGFIGDKPIHASIDLDDSYGVYVYDRFNQPIRWTSGRETLKDATILLQEHDDQYAPPKTPPIALITLKQNPKNTQQIIGTWENAKTGQQFPIQLTRYDEPAGSLQSAALKTAYVRKTCTEANKKVMRIYEKSTNRLLHTIETSGECHDDEVDVDDYNFDGFEDFSVFESSFAGPNTTSAYYLYNPKTKAYEHSDQLTDVTLSFDGKNKTVTSTNQCCAGSQILIQRSKWQGNTLKLVGKTCLKYNDKKGELVKTQPNACD
jgi:hypothetical protein